MAEKQDRRMLRPRLGRDNQESRMEQTGREVGCCKHWEPVDKHTNRGQSDGKKRKVLHPVLVEGRWEERDFFYERDWVGRGFVSNPFTFLLNKCCGFSVLQSLRISFISL